MLNFLSRFDHGSFPLFKGLEQYKLLWNEGFLVPDYSVIRVMWNVCRGDEHYGVLQDGRLEGIKAPAHQGNPGVHDAKDLLFRKLGREKLVMAFEAHHLIPEQRRELRPESLRLR
ncbi:MAG: hypothetical protein AABW82_00190 [Nanoarchaeota archaeon]